ncbi:MAG TPA: hypothetical protein VFE58_00015 [Tepidisphaeraceae bacterium]|jgi:ABC-type multidrug transport system permease subunit|nr:hypothetical protein [Tepidisphaeraceae bacterium]
MTIYRKPAFWLLLIFWQLLAFLAAACLCTGLYLTLTLLHHGPPEHWQIQIIFWIARLSHLLFAILAFILTKRRMHFVPRAQGFPVIQQSNIS